MDKNNKNNSTDLEKTDNKPDSGKDKKSVNSGHSPTENSSESIRSTENPQSQPPQDNKNENNNQKVFTKKKSTSAVGHAKTQSFVEEDSGKIVKPQVQTDSSEVQVTSDDFPPQDSQENKATHVLKKNQKTEILSSDSQELQEEKQGKQLEDGPLTGRLFEGKYKVGKLLGEGGMGQVYKATHVMMRNEVALKILLPDFIQKTDIVERFRREAESASRLNSPNIINVKDFGRSEDNIFYLVMEYVDGNSLGDLLIDAPFNWRRACRLMIQILEALDLAHQKGIIHRDLKPDNIMVVEGKGGDELVKILDFGIAKLNETSNDIQVTKAGMIFGTPTYLSPEQAQGKNVTFASDIYSTGILLYQMVTGRIPFESESTITLINAHINEPPPRPRQYVNSLPEGLESIILKSLSKTPRERFNSAYHMQVALEKLMEIPSARTTIPIQVSSKLGDFFYTGLGKLLIFVLPLVLLVGIAFFFFFDIKLIDRESDVKTNGYQPAIKNDYKDTKIKLKETSLVKNLVKKGKLEQAIKMAEFNLEKEPSSVKYAKELTYARKAFVEKNKHQQVKELYSIKERSEIDKFVVKLENWEKWFPRDEVVNLALGLGYFKIKNYAAAIKHIAKALLLSPRFCEKKEVKDAIVEMLSDKRQWVRARALDLVKEAYLKTPLKQIKFLLPVVNDNQLDVDTRYGVYAFLHRRGLDDGIKYNIFWRKQLRWSTSCDVRAKAANWFHKNGTKEDLSFLEVRVKDRSFRTGSGKKVSSNCYRPELKKAVKAIKRRKDKKKST